MELLRLRLVRRNALAAEPGHRNRRLERPKLINHGQLMWKEGIALYRLLGVDPLESVLKI